jgi:hypothetical protein
MGLGTFLSAHGDAMLYGGISGAITSVPTWIVSNIILKPISIVRDKRGEALQVGERFSFVTLAAPEERIRTVRYKLNDVASELRALARAQPWSARLYCHFLEYDLETSATLLMGLAEMAGTGTPEGLRRNHVDALHWCLRAHRHLSADRIYEIQQMLADARQQQTGCDDFGGGTAIRVLPRGRPQHLAVDAPATEHRKAA